MKLSIPRCPECGEPPAGTVDTIPNCLAQFTDIDDEGNVDYEGTTNVNWDGQTTDQGPTGKPLVQCSECHHEWETDIDWEA